MSFQSRSEARLADNLRTGLWSFQPRGSCGSPQRPPSRSKVRLSPLGSATPPAPVQPNVEAPAPAQDFLPSPIFRAPSVGHLGALWGMRQSEPSFSVTTPSPIAGSSLRRSAPNLGHQDTLCSSWRNGEIPGSADASHSCHVHPGSRCGQRDVRSRRIRRPADFGANLGNSQLRSHSCLGPNERKCGGNLVDVAECFSSTSQSSTAVMTRCSSTPPTGTLKADDAAAAARAKAVAVAALQRLFFEEMSKNGQDANGAAARALLRLSETPSLPSVLPPSQSETHDKSQQCKATSQRNFEEDEDAPCVEEEMPAQRRAVQDIAEFVFSPLGAPRRPLAEEGRRRRPCMRSHVKVQS